MLYIDLEPINSSSKGSCAWSDWPRWKTTIDHVSFAIQFLSLILKIGIVLLYHSRLVSVVHLSARPTLSLSGLASRRMRRTSIQCSTRGGAGRSQAAVVLAFPRSQFPSPFLSVSQPQMQERQVCCIPYNARQGPDMSGRQDTHVSMEG